ncbi:MAG: hypothetical protein ACRDGI_07450 [Candidatus Limnocylindrales bacterium]
MSTADEWEVRDPGNDPECDHPVWRDWTLPAVPPIREVRCDRCERVIWRRTRGIETKPWPESV